MSSSCNAKMSNSCSNVLNKSECCDTLDKKWGEDGLKQVWNNCVENNPIKNDPEWKGKSKKTVDSKINSYCCEEVMQCCDPNDWFSKNSINVQCAIKKDPDYPVFGDIKYTEGNGKNNSIWWGVR
jgi:hypothetical protein